MQALNKEGEPFKIRNLMHEVQHFKSGMKLQSKSFTESQK
jgi:hypothetical protein